MIQLHVLLWFRSRLEFTRTQCPSRGRKPAEISEVSHKLVLNSSARTVERCRKRSRLLRSEGGKAEEVNWVIPKAPKSPSHQPVYSFFSKVLSLTFD